MSDVKEIKEKIRNYKILFADDEEQIRKTTAMFLEKFFDDVVICKDGQEGLDIFSQNPTFDIIIADIQMPKVNGIDMVKKIKETKPDIFTIFITASRGDVGLDEDIYDLYITKPISYDDIKTIMEKISTLK